jgi:hypothetical protein
VLVTAYRRSRKPAVYPLRKWSQSIPICRSNWGREIGTLLSKWRADQKLASLRAGDIVWARAADL